MRACIERLKLLLCSRINLLAFQVITVRFVRDAQLRLISLAFPQSCGWCLIQNLLWNTQMRSELTYLAFVQGAKWCNIHRSIAPFGIESCDSFRGMVCTHYK
ncbi:hypothetical protein D3C75_961890 [compost metagenome]